MPRFLFVWSSILRKQVWSWAFARRIDTHKGNMNRSACINTYILLSLAFIGINLATLSNLPPWIDEVMMLDTSYNAAVHQCWTTTAWYRVAGQYPFSTSPPLYQLLATAWIWLFGGSLVAVRSLNLLITFVLGGVCLRLVQRNVRPTPWTVALFTMLLWGSSEMAWMYRNGRPDMLCALLSVFTIQTINRHLSVPSPATRLAVIATSALLLCSGIQAAVYLCVLWLFFFIAQKGWRRKQFLHPLALLLTGFTLGLFLVALFMLAHGRLIGFASSIIQYSATLSDIVLAILPTAGKWFGFNPAPYTEKLLELTTRSSLSETMASILDYRNLLVLSAVALTAYLDAFWMHLHKLWKDRGFLLLLCALYVPVVMTLAGRFAPYYRWMAFLPLLASIVSVSARCRKWGVVFGVVAAMMSIGGLKSMRASKHWDYDGLHSFVQRQHFKPSDAVVCPFSVFYEVKPICDTCYFAGIFPVEFISHIDYIIEATDGSGFNQPITDYVNKLKADTSVVLTPIDHCNRPSLTLYRIQKKHKAP